MQQITFTIDLEMIVIVLSGLTVAISSWAILYFGARIIIHAYLQHNLGSMPSADEISKLYRRNNEAIQGLIDNVFIQRATIIEHSQDENSE